MSPTRARSTGDLLAEKDKARARTKETSTVPSAIPPRPRDSGRSQLESCPPSIPCTGSTLPPKVDKPKKDPYVHLQPFLVHPMLMLLRPAAQWATLDELLDKLLFLAVSGDGMFMPQLECEPVPDVGGLDPAFISHFLLTYRRFAAPRSVLLAMQKRMRQLDNPCGDPMFACFAQMR